MTNKNLRISGEIEATLDVGELIKLTLKNDNVQSSDTRRDDLLLVMTERPADNLSQSL